MGVRGDFGPLRKLRTQLKAAADPPFRAALTNDLAETSLALVNEGFERGVDPEDNPWARLELGNGQILRKSGRLQRSFTKVPTDRGFQIGSSVRSADEHQEGATIVPTDAPVLRFNVDGQWYTASKVTIPQRKMLPDGELGERWTRRLKETARRFIDGRFR